MKKIKIAMIGNLLLINFSFAGDVKILDNPSMPKIIAITSGTVTLILTGCLGVKMHKKRQAIDSNEKEIKK